MQAEVSGSPKIPGNPLPLVETQKTIYPPSCSVCHGVGNNPAPNGTSYPNTRGAHTVHVEQNGYDCHYCHNTLGGPGATGHYDFIAPADVVLSITETLIGTSATYHPSSKTCNNIYCHDPGGNSLPESAPVWDDTRSVYCGSCHYAFFDSLPEDLNLDGKVNDSDLALFSLGWGTEDSTETSISDISGDGSIDAIDLIAILEQWQKQQGPSNTLAGSHAVHFDSVRGPGIRDCTVCHPGNEPLHSPVDGVVLFADGKNLAETTVCNHCHGTTAQDKPVWGGMVFCSDCHKAENPANSRADGTGIPAPDPSTWYYTKGHGLDPDQQYVITGNPGAGLSDCLGCHEKNPLEGRHITHLSGDEKRLRRIPEDTLPSTTTITELCLDCHRPGQVVDGFLGRDANSEAMIHSAAVTGHYGSPQSAPEAFPAYGNQDSYESSPGYQCITCHNPHGTTNLGMIRTEIDGMVGGISNPSSVVLTENQPHWTQNGTGICEVCHQPAGLPHPDTRHPGNHQTGQDCRGCHQNHPNSFQPTASSTSCMSCHEMPQNDRRAITGEFARISHHVIGDVTDTDCLVCHDQSTHQSGTIRLINYDIPGSPVEMNTPSSAELFCLGCHDSDGAGGNLEPFADGGIPSDIASTWMNSSHKLAGQTCLDCHENSHGSEKRKLLSPSQIPATSPSLAEEQEGFCYGCHGNSGPAITNIQAQFSLVSHHDVAYMDQSAHGSRIECTSCHNPHVDTQQNPIIDPDNPEVVWQGNAVSFCLRCHDGSPPEGVQFPSPSQGSGYDKNLFTASIHGLSGIVSCNSCHQPHGSIQTSLKTQRYDQNDRVTYTTGGPQYQLCWQCHQESIVVGNEARNAFGTLHDKHVKGEDSACIECHDPHTGFDTGESGLISFVYPVKKGWSFNLTVNGTTYTQSSSFVDTGTNRGSCYLDCHGKKHTPKTYTGITVNTLR